MKTETTTIKEDGFEGYYYSKNVTSDKCMILLPVMAGNSGVAKDLAKWLNRQNVAALGISMFNTKQIPCRQSEMPLEWVESAVDWLQKKGKNKIGVLGMSFGAIMALAASAYIPDISMVISLSGYDYVIEGMEGTGKKEVPSGHSGFTWRGKELPYQPYYLSGEEFRSMMAEQTKLHGEAYGRGIWEHSVQVKEPADECYIPLENSNAAIYLFADKPDTCWDTAAGSTRLANRLKNAGYTKPVKLKIYEHGYYILLPDCVFMGRVAGMMFKEGKKYKKECRETRQDIQRTIENALKTWK